MAQIAGIGNDLGAVKNDLGVPITEVKNNLGAQIAGVKNNLGKDIKEARTDLTKGINQLQFLVTYAPLVLIEDLKKFDMMQQRLKAFHACVRGGGTDECIKSKQ